MILTNLIFCSNPRPLEGGTGQSTVAEGLCLIPVMEIADHTPKTMMAIDWMCSEHVVVCPYCWRIRAEGNRCRGPEVLGCSGRTPPQVLGCSGKTPPQPHRSHTAIGVSSFTDPPRGATGIGDGTPPGQVGDWGRVLRSHRRNPSHPMRHSRM